jgi:hypothetical protein
VRGEGYADEPVSWGGGVRPQGFSCGGGGERGASSGAGVVSRGMKGPTAAPLFLPETTEWAAAAVWVRATAPARATTRQGIAGGRVRLLEVGRRRLAEQDPRVGRGCDERQFRFGRGAGLICRTVIRKGVRDGSSEHGRRRRLE